jgi:hypothetical protein
MVQPQRLFAKEGVFEAVDYHPHLAQKKVHEALERNKVVAAGRRTGKSVIGGQELTVEGLYTHTQLMRLEDLGIRREFWIVGPEYSDSEKEFRVCYNALKKLGVPFDKPGTYNNPEMGSLSISLWKGKFLVHGMSAKYPGTLVGEGLHGVIMAEAAKMKASVWTKYIRPTLADFRGWALHSSTPEGRNHFYELWKLGQDPNNKRWKSWRMPSWVNEYVFPMGASFEAIEQMRQLEEAHIPITDEILMMLGVDEEIYAMFADMSRELFNQEVAADFSEYVGRVFKDFDEEYHVADLKYNPEWPLYAACDYGWSNPFVWLWIQIDPLDDIVYVLGEYRKTQTDIGVIASELATAPLIKQVRTFYPDPAGPGDTSVLSNKLHIQANTGTGGEKKYRLEYIREALKTFPKHAKFEDQRAKLYIDRSCSEMIREMNEYRYPDNNNEMRPNKEEPLDKDDHGPEALGRFFRGYFGPPSSTQGGHAVVTTAKVTR